MKNFILLLLIVLGGPLLAEDAVSESSGFGAWRLSVGGAMNAGVRTRLHHQATPMPASYVPQHGSVSAANGLKWGDGFVRDDSYGHGSSTINWKLPASNYNGDGTFTMINGYDEVISSSLSKHNTGNTDADYQPGVSIELSRTLYAIPEYSCGIDFAVAISYFFGKNLYKSNGGYSRTDIVNSGEYHTTIDAHQAMADYQDGIYVQSFDGYYGDGAMSGSGHPGILWRGVSSPMNVNTKTITHRYASSYSASGDYRDLELLFMVKPWYEVCNWCRVFGELGVGVNRSQFDFKYSAMGIGGSVHDSHTYSDWDVYGVGGAGVVFRLGRLDLSVDFLARFLDDGLDVKGKYVHGCIEQADWLMRVMIGIEF